MVRFVWTLLAGFAVGTPAVTVGLSLSLPGPVALFAVLLGAACCVVFAVFAMERARLRWQSWRARRKSSEIRAGSPGSSVGGAPSDGAAPVGSPSGDRLSSTAGRRARRVFERYGVVGFGIVAPALFGTWGSSLLGAALGIPRWRLIRWLMAGVTLWCTVLLVASDAAFDAFGIG
ncbi:hypothetical protein [Streptomyces katsurahamanus]|uniref:Small multi-drug export protein n=1 Tax=Streptomyces katsurahamanus TaxID=2577098 RepID=A0ABW9NRH9_9ACTN|nr:hypothetical protein [Streptomyces katsurahamanus]MQS35915.1 hypothetical protein [Streptomyces katsurahamanus]